MHTYRNSFITNSQPDPEILLHPLKLRVNFMVTAVRQLHPELKEKSNYPICVSIMGRGFIKKIPMTLPFSPICQVELCSGIVGIVTSDIFQIFIAVQNHSGLCQVVLLQDLCEKFLTSAKKYTKKGIKKCGVLNKTLIHI
jgi:hypothetical protein